MTKEEIRHDLEVICPKIIKTTGCNDGTICADCIADCLKTMGYCKRETLLKEFVEWLKSEYAREEHFEREEAKDCQEKGYVFLYEYHKGEECMAEKIKDMLNSDLEKFLEERKK